MNFMSMILCMFIFILSVLSVKFLYKGKSKRGCVKDCDHGHIYDEYYKNLK